MRTTDLTELFEIAGMKPALILAAGMLMAAAAVKLSQRAETWKEERRFEKYKAARGRYRELERGRAWAVWSPRFVKSVTDLRGGDWYYWTLPGWWCDTYRVGKYSNRARLLVAARLQDIENGAV